MSPGLTTERIFKVLKEQIMRGERPPGERLDPARLAHELTASTTPVRDALHQLLGERMVEAYPQQGFQVPVLSETGLRELYVWNADLLTLLLRNWRGGAGAAVAPARNGPSVADATTALFDAIAVTLGTGEHRRAVRHASDRLHLARTSEQAALPGTEEEVDRLICLWTRQSAGELRATLQRYHRRRLAAVPGIVALLNRADR